MVKQCGLVDRAGIVVQTAGNGQVHGEILLGNAEGGEVGGDGLQFRKAGVENLALTGVALQSGNDLGVGAANGDEAQNVVRLGFFQTAVLQEDGLYLVGADLVQLVHGAHDVAALLGQTQHIIEAGEDFPVVDPNLESGQAEAPEDLVDNGGDFRLIENIQLSVADDVDIRLVEFPEAASLGSLTPVDLADLEAAEGKGQLIVVQGNVFGQRHGQIEPQGQIAVALGEAVDLLLGFAAALGQKDLGILNGGGIQGGKAVGGVGPAEDRHHFFQLDLLIRQQFHKAGKGAGFDHIHKVNVSSEFCLAVDHFTPVQVAPLQAQDEHLGGGQVGSNGDILLVAVADGLDHLGVVPGVGGVGVGKEQHQVDLVVGDAGIDLLVATLLVGKQQGDGQTCIVRNQPPGGGGGVEAVLLKDALVGRAELNHQFLLFVMGQKCNIHTGHSLSFVIVLWGR